MACVRLSELERSRVACLLAGGTAPGWLLRAWDRFRFCSERAEQRRALRYADAQTLRDLGPGLLSHEMDKPFWHDQGAMPGVGDSPRGWTSRQCVVASPVCRQWCERYQATSGTHPACCLMTEYYRNFSCRRRPLLCCEHPLCPASARSTQGTGPAEPHVPSLAVSPS